MSRAFEHLDSQQTAIGEISLRRRLEPTLQVDVWEVKLGDTFLMSSLFTAGEEAVANLGLAALSGDDLRVVVGGLGLGHTAGAALADPRVGRIHVVEALAAVIGWHECHLVPLGAALSGDERCDFVHDDFFALIDRGFPPDVGGDLDAILLDIDHTPSHLLDGSHAGFYRPEGLQRVVDHLRPGGVFSLWSDEFSPNEEFVDVMRSVFATVVPHVVAFPNHYTGGESTSTIYVATTPGSSPSGR